MTVIELVGWVAGFMFVGLFLSYLSIGFINTLCFLILAIILIPPTSKFVFETFKIKINKFLLALILVIIALATTTSSRNKTKKEPSETIDSPTPTSAIIETPTPTPTTQPTPTVKIVKKVVAPTTKPAETNIQKTQESGVSAVYKSALTKASLYANTMYMSKRGVYDQLVSEYGEKFSADAAQYGIDNVKANWNANALKKAKMYQDTMSMSPDAIRDQLVSDYGEKFTQDEANYAIQHLNG